MVAKNKTHFKGHTPTAHMHHFYKLQAIMLLAKLSVNIKLGANIHSKDMCQKLLFSTTMINVIEDNSKINRPYLTGSHQTHVPCSWARVFQIVFRRANTASTDARQVARAPADACVIAGSKWMQPRAPGR